MLRLSVTEGKHSLRIRRWFSRRHAWDETLPIERSTAEAGRGAVEIDSERSRTVGSEKEREG